MAAAAVATALVGVTVPAHVQAGSGASRPAPTSQVFDVVDPEFVGFTQEQPTWCYTAVTQTLQHAFATPVASQAEIAHRNVYQLGEALLSLHGGSNRLALEENAAVYYVNRLNAYAERRLLDGREPIDPSVWSNVADLVAGSFRLSAILNHTKGNLNVDDRQTRMISAPSTFGDEEMMDVIDEKGLIVILRDGHYTVIYGYEYEVPAEGDPILHLAVWDPARGVGKKYVSADSVRDEASNLTVVTR